LEPLVPLGVLAPRGAQRCDTRATVAFHYRVNGAHKFAHVRAALGDSRTRGLRVCVSDTLARNDVAKSFTNF
jgi:hypothetical protein